MLGSVDRCRAGLATVMAVILALAIACAAPPQPTPAPTAISTPPSPAGQKPDTKTADQPSAKSAEKPAPQPPAELVKVGVLGILADAGLFLAQDRGHFAEQGIRVEFVNTAGTTDQLAPIATGEISVGQQAISAGIINAAARGIPLKIAVGVHTIYPNKPTATRIVIRKALLDSGQVKTPADLKGKTIAIESRGIGQEIYFMRLLQQGGLKYPDDVKIVTMPLPDMVTAFANNAIDLANLSEPLISRGADQGILASYKQPYELYPTNQLSVLVFSPNFANNQTDLAKRFTIAYLKGVRDYLDAFGKGTEKESVIQSLMRYTTVKDRALYEKMIPVTLAPNGEIRSDDIEFQQNWYLESGVIKEKIPASRIVDTQFVKNAVEKLGEYK